MSCAMPFSRFFRPAADRHRAMKNEGLAVLQIFFSKRKYFKGKSLVIYPFAVLLF